MANGDHDLVPVGPGTYEVEHDILFGGPTIPGTQPPAITNGSGTRGLQDLIDAGVLVTTGVPDLYLQYDEYTRTYQPVYLGAGTPGGATGPTQAQLDIQREANRLTERGQDITAELTRIGHEIVALRDQQANAIAQGNLALSRQIETRMAQNEDRRIALEGERNDIQRQQLGINQQLANIQAQQAAISGTLGAGNLLGQIGTNLGNIEARRSENLAQLAANPRDFPQLNIALGGGTSFLDQLLGREQVGPQGTRQINQPTLGPGFQRLIDAVTQRPDLDYFQQAAQRAGEIPAFGALNQGASQAAAPVSLAGGGKMVIKEPVVGIGTQSGLPLFTLAEGGEPEMMEVMPMQEGGTVKVDPAAPLETTSPLQRTIDKAVQPPGYGIEQPGAPPRPEPLLPPGYGIPSPDAPPRPEMTLPPSFRDAIADPSRPPGANTDIGQMRTLLPLFLEAIGRPPPSDIVPKKIAALDQLIAEAAAGRGDIPYRDLVRQRSALTAPDVRLGPELLEGYREYADLIGQTGLQRFGLDQRLATLEELRRTAGALTDQRTRAAAPPAQQPFFNPGDAIRRLMNFTPRQFFSLLPSQLQFLGGASSQLAVPPEDFFQSLLRGFPTAPNPARINFGNF